MMNFLLLAVALSQSANAQTVAAAAREAGSAASVHRENMARRQTAEKLKRICEAKGFQALNEKAELACAYAKAHGDADMALFLAFQWNMKQHMNQSYGVGLRNPHVDRAERYEKEAAALRDRARAAGAITEVEGLDAVGITAGKDFNPGG